MRIIHFLLFVATICIPAFSKADALGTVASRSPPQPDLGVASYGNFIAEALSKDQMPPPLNDLYLRGKVLIEFTVSPSGHLDRAGIVSSSGIPALDQVALDDVTNMKFVPFSGDMPKRQLTFLVPFIFSAQDKRIDSTDLAMLNSELVNPLLASNSVAVAIKKYFPEKYLRLLKAVQANSNATQINMALAEISEKILVKFKEQISAQNYQKFATLKISQLQYLRQTDANLCFDFIEGLPRTTSVKSLFPTAMIETQDTFIANIIKQIATVPAETVVPWTKDELAPVMSAALKSMPTDEADRYTQQMLTDLPKTDYDLDDDRATCDFFIGLYSQIALDPSDTAKRFFVHYE